MNIALISLGSGGTMGHMSVLTRLAVELKKYKYNYKILSDHDYKQFSNQALQDTDFIKLPKQEHTKTTGGLLTYKYSEQLFKIIKKERFDAVIFSTFFDKNLVSKIRGIEVNTFLINYPLRDSHRKVMKFRHYNKYFTKIFTLQGLSNTKIVFSNEILVSPMLKIDKSSESLTFKKILISPGGGGRPSTEMFFRIMQEAINKLHKERPFVEFYAIKGNSNFIFDENTVKMLRWSNNFLEFASTFDLVISEAGYFSVTEMLSIGKPCLLIPGERRIDNQELRALQYEELGCGKCIFPQEDPCKIVDSINELVDTKGLIQRQSENSIKVCKNILLSETPLIVALKDELKNINSR